MEKYIFICYIVLYCVFNIVGICNILKIFGLCKEYKMKNRLLEFIFSLFFMVFSLFIILTNSVLLKIIIGVWFSFLILTGIINLICVFIVKSIEDDIKEKYTYNKSMYQQDMSISIYLMFANLIPFLMLFYV